MRAAIGFGLFLAVGDPHKRAKPACLVLADISYRCVGLVLKFLAARRFSSAGVTAVVATENALEPTAAPL